jgi:hypothetical protein
MKQTINDVLLQLAEAAQEQRLALSADMAVYQKLSHSLPRLFPAPDEFYTRSAVATEYDAAFIYNTYEGEHSEALRIILSMFFSILEWEIEIEKDSQDCSLRTVKVFGSYKVLIRITGVDAKFFEYKLTHDSGTVLTGAVRCSKFVPLDIQHPDISPEIFQDRLRSTSYRDFIHSKQAYICSLAAQGFPSNTPLPDDIQPALGMHYDLDISYLGDPKGLKRAKIDALLGYHGWSGVIEKKDGGFSLHTIVPLQCREHILQVRISIIQAHKYSEQLYLAAEASDKLFYKAVRPSDSDYIATIETFKQNEAS